MKIAQCDDLSPHVESPLPYGNSVGNALANNPLQRKHLQIRQGVGGITTSVVFLACSSISAG